MNLIAYNSIEAFNEAMQNKSDDLIYFVKDGWELDQSHSEVIKTVFEEMDIVTCMYTDTNESIISYPPFAPNKYLSAMVMQSPIITRANIGVEMESDSYQDFFNKTAIKYMYYHLAKPAFVRKK